MSKALANRRLGQLPLSVATSIAFESLLNMEPSEDASEHVRRPKGEHKPILDYKYIWVNLRTLIRNIEGAIDKDVTNDASPMDYYRTLITEITTIENIVSQISNAPKIIYYAKTYNSLTKIWRHALFRDVTSSKMKIYSVKEKNILEQLYDDISNGIYSKDKIILGDCFLNIEDDSALISHFPIDLILRKGGKFKALIESHTGAIKLRQEWNTKLRDGKKYPRIPFDKAMIQIFGDKENMLSPQTMQIRKKLSEISEKYHWTPLTTKDRILFCIKQENEPVLLQLVRDCY